MKTRKPTARPCAAPVLAAEAPAAGRSNQEAIEALNAALDHEPEHPFLHEVGEKLGLGAGFVVTELLALVPSWNDSLLEEDGDPVQQVEGATRIGDHDIEKRHTQVVGPKILDYAEDLAPGLWKDFVAGVGEGASDAPGASYRFEAALADHFRR